MKGGKAPLGYTVLEVMIVLAISGVMFLIASTFINGKQENTAFTQGVNEFANRIQSVANQVGDGQFSDVNLPRCQVNAATFVTFSTISGNQAQGTNNDCVFLGKLLYVYRHSTPRPQNYSQFTLAGALTHPVTGDPITDLNAYRDFISAVSNSNMQLTVRQNIPQSLDVTQMRVMPPGGSWINNFSIGFIQGLGTASAAAGPNPPTYQTGSQTVGMVYSDALTTPNNDGTGDNFVAIAAARVNRHIFYAGRVQICVTDNVRRAIIDIDVETGGLNVDVRRLDGGGAVCW